MIDILLVLLIIFMITQPLSRMAIDVQVPPPETTTATQQNNNQIVLELDDDGGYAINGQPVPKDQLDTQIHAIFDPRPAKLLFIKAGAEPALSGRDPGDGRGPGGRRPDHRLHPGRSEQIEVGRPHGSESTRGSLRAPARAFGAPGHVSEGGHAEAAIFTQAHRIILGGPTRAPQQPLQILLPGTERRYGGLVVSLLFHACLRGVRSS